MDKTENTAVVAQLHAEHALGKLETVTEAAVWKACDLLAGQGLGPTIDAVRRVLGKGNRATINHHRREWEKHRAQQRAAIAAAPETPAKVLEMLELLWIEAVRFGRIEADALKAQQEAQAASHRQELDQLTCELGNSEAQVEALEAELETERAATTAEREARDTEITEYRTQARAAEARAAEAMRQTAAAVAERDALRAMLDRIASRLPSQEHIAAAPHQSSCAAARDAAGAHPKSGMEPSNTETG